MINENPDQIHIVPSQIPVRDVFNLILESIAPRPIAFASTVDPDGNPNLSPFSFFNGFGGNPPVLVFSPSRRGRDNTTKDTYDNIKQVPEVCINVVNYKMVHQVSLASSEYPKGTNEFIKAGFTMVKSDLIKPFRVKESPIQFECKVLNVIETGDQGSAGNLVICEIIKVHINKNVLEGNGKIDINKLDLVGRMGGDYYVRASGDALFTVPKPTGTGIGIDALPSEVRNSKILTGNDLGQLGNVEALPQDSSLIAQEVKEYIDAIKRKDLLKDKYILEAHKQAAFLIEKDKTEVALKLLLQIHSENYQ